MSLSDWEAGPLITTQGPDDCQDPRCRRINGVCHGWHCAECGEPSSYQGHYTKLDDGEWGFSCQKVERGDDG